MKINNKKLVIWIIAANSVGKTSLSRHLHKYFGDTVGINKTRLRRFKKTGMKYCFTEMSPISANLGNLKGNACSGTDTLGKKEQIIAATNESLKHHSVVIVEGIMATSQWIKFLKRSDTILLLIHLKVEEKTMFNRLRQRRGLKLGISPDKVEITSKTEKNMMGKVRGFQSMFNKLKDQVDISLEIDTNGKSIEQVGKITINTINKKIFEL